MELFIFYSIITELDRFDCKFKNTKKPEKRNAREVYINKCVEIGHSNPDSGCKVGTNNVKLSAIHKNQQSNSILIGC